MNISVLAFPHYLTCGILFNLNILKSDFRIKRFSNKPKTLVIYYSRIKHFLPLVSKVGLLFVLFFSVLRECFFLPVSISLPWRIFLPRSSWEKNRPGAKNGHGGGKNLPLNRKTSPKRPTFLHSWRNNYYSIVVYKLVFLVSRSDSRNRSFLYHLPFAGRMQ